MRLVTQANQIVLKFEGIEQLYALRRQLTVQKSSVVSAEYIAVFKDWQKIELRLPGTFLPGVILAGSFYTSNGWDFIYGLKPRGWTRPTLHGVLVIETPKQRFRRIIVTVSETQANEVKQWLKT